MKIKILESFNFDLNEQVEYIARDKPSAARKFKSDILKILTDLRKYPYKNRKSIFFENEDIRDLIFKGYVIVYFVKNEEREIEVFGLIKYREGF